MQQATKWVFDLSHTKVGFSVRHFGITETDGFFRNFTGNIAVSDKVKINIPVQLLKVQ